MIFVGWAEPVSDTRSLQAECALRRGLDQRPAGGAGAGGSPSRERTSSRFMSLCLSLSPVDSTDVFPQTDAGLGPRRGLSPQGGAGPGEQSRGEAGCQRGSGEAGPPALAETVPPQEARRLSETATSVETRPDARWSDGQRDRRRAIRQREPQRLLCRVRAAEALPAFFSV